MADDIEPRGETQSVEEEAERSAEADLAEAHRMVDALRDLIYREGWAIVREHLERGIQTRRNEYELKPLDNILELGKQEFMKGEIAQARLVIALPVTLIEAAKATIELEAQIEEAKKADTEENGNGGQPDDQDPDD